MQDKVSIVAKTVEQAIVIASGKLGVAQEQIDFKVIKKSGGGFFSFLTSPKVEIEAWKKSDSKNNQSSRGQHENGRGNGRDNGRDNRRGAKSQQDSGREDKPRNSNNSEGANRSENRGGRGNGGGRHNKNSAERADRQERSREPREARDPNAIPAEPLTTAQLDVLRTELKDFLAKTCTLISGEPTEVTATLTDKRLQLDIQNEFIQEEIQKNPKLVEALEHLVRKKPRHLKQELPFRVFIDANGNRKSREQELLKVAAEMSNEVFETKKSMVLNYRSSYDRKIIHMALEKDDRVVTKSIGSGPQRKLMILPADDQEAASQSAAE